MSLNTIQNRNNQLLKTIIFIIILWIASNSFFISLLFILNFLITIFLGFIIINIVCLILLIYFYKKDPHKYSISEKGISLKYYKFQKDICWDNIKEIEKLQPKPYIGPLWTIVTNDKEKIFIGSFLDRDVVIKIINDYNIYKQKSQT